MAGYPLCGVQRVCGLRAVAPGDTGVSLGLWAVHSQALPVWAEHTSWCAQALTVLALLL